MEQTSEGLWQFWLSYYQSIETLFIDILRNFEGSRVFQSREDEEIAKLIYRLTNEIGFLTTKCLQSQDFNIRTIKNSLIIFSNHFHINLIDNEQDDKFYIYFSKDPKDYFVDIVDTEPRMVCFIDILGFSDLINSYDDDLTSTALQDIQESFSLAKRRLFDEAPNIDKELIKHLRYQSFSDNICISIPYFDNQTDFVLNLNLLTLYVRSFQFLMMIKGFYTRGGLSLGSFYANENIIFSKGLVKAYHLESKKAIYPRVIIDPEIIQKLDGFESKCIIDTDLNNSIIFDWENAAFLNPFGLLDNIGIRSKLSLEEEDRDDYMINLRNDIRASLSGYLQGDIEGEISGFEVIKRDVLGRIGAYHKDGNIATKYIWLLEFMKWWEGDESASLKFSYYL